MAKCCKPVKTPEEPPKTPVPVKTPVPSARESKPEKTPSPEKQKEGPTNCGAIQKNSPNLCTAPEYEAWNDNPEGIELSAEESNKEETKVAKCCKPATKLPGPKGGPDEEQPTDCSALKTRSGFERLCDNANLAWKEDLNSITIGPDESDKVMLFDSIEYKSRICFKVFSRLIAMGIDKSFNFVY